MTCGPMTHRPRTRGSGPAARHPRQSTTHQRIPHETIQRETQALRRRVAGSTVKRMTARGSALETISQDPRQKDTRRELRSEMSRACAAATRGVDRWARRRASAARRRTSSSDADDRRPHARSAHREARSHASEQHGQRRSRAFRAGTSVTCFRSIPESSTLAGAEDAASRGM
jgi:hypothetical protein